MQFLSAFSARLIAPTMALALLAACQTAETDTSPTTGNCAQSEAGCLQNNITEVRKMIADPENEWVDETGPGVGSTGNRLLAYIGSAPQLTCSQLSLGEVETGNVLNDFDEKQADGQEDADKNLLDVATKASKAIATEKEKRC